MKIGFPGERGSYSEAAAAYAFATDISTKSLPTIDLVFDALKSGEISYGVVPVENNLTGNFPRTFENLRTRSTFIRNILRLRTRWCLASAPGTKEDDIQHIYGHPGALLACENYLRNHINLKMTPSFDLFDFEEEIVQDKGGDRAVLTSTYSARCHGLTILKDDCSGPPATTTQYLVLCREPEIPDCTPGEAVTMVQFYVPHRPGMMVEALKVFARYELNIVGHKTWSPSDARVVAFIQVNTIYTDERVQSALDDLRGIATQPRHLGSYTKRDIDI